MAIRPGGSAMLSRAVVGLAVIEMATVDAHVIRASVRPTAEQGAAGVSSAARVAQFRWRGPMGNRRTIKIVGVRGRIAVVGGGGNAVELTAIRTSRDGFPDSVEIVVQQSADEISFLTRYPPPPLGPPQECMYYDPERGDFWHSDVVVDFVVRIPRQVGVTAKLFAGDVSVADLAGAVDVSTNSGTITLANVDGPIRAASIGDLVVDSGTGRHLVAPQPAILKVYQGTLRLTIGANEADRFNDAIVLPRAREEREVARADDASTLVLEGTLAAAKRMLRIEISRGAWTVTRAAH